MPFMTDYPAGGGPSLIEGVWNAVNRAVRGGGKDGIPEVSCWLVVISLLLLLLICCYSVNMLVTSV